MSLSVVQVGTVDYQASINNGGNVACTLPLAPTPGNLIFCMAAFGSGSSTVPSSGTFTLFDNDTRSAFTAYRIAQSGDTATFASAFTNQNATTIPFWTMCWEISGWTGTFSAATYLSDLFELNGSVNDTWSNGSLTTKGSGHSLVLIGACNFGLYTAPTTTPSGFSTDSTGHGFYAGEDDNVAGGTNFAASSYNVVWNSNAGADFCTGAMAMIWDGVTAALPYQPWYQRAPILAQ